MKHSPLIFPKKVRALRSVKQHIAHETPSWYRKTQSSFSSWGPKTWKAEWRRETSQLVEILRSKAGEVPIWEKQQEPPWVVKCDLWGSTEAQVIRTQTPESEVRLSWISLEILTAQLPASFLETRHQVSGSSAVKAGESYLRQSHSDAPEEISLSPEGSWPHRECQDCWVTGWGISSQTGSDGFDLSGWGCPGASRISHVWQLHSLHPAHNLGLHTSSCPT